MNYHELGLHGFHHELWGRSLWFDPKPSASASARRFALQDGLDAFAAAGLPRPLAFRAPYLVADRLTLELLCEYGFILDSSEAAFRGCLPIVTRYKSLVRIPASASPRPRIRRRFGLPTWAPFRLLNLATFVGLPIDELLATIAEIFAVQDSVGVRRHLVVFAHPWEFDELAEYNGSPMNYERLKGRVALLSQCMPLTFAPLGEVASLDQNRAGAESPESEERVH
jgi:hypothetical protein